MMGVGMRMVGRVVWMGCGKVMCVIMGGVKL